jgi:ribosomal protein L34
MEIISWDVCKQVKEFIFGSNVISDNGKRFLHWPKKGVISNKRLRVLAREMRVGDKLIAPNKAAQRGFYERMRKAHGVKCLRSRRIKGSTKFLCERIQ